MVATVLADTVVSISDLKKNPMVAVWRRARGFLLLWVNASAMPYTKPLRKGLEKEGPDTRSRSLKWLCLSGRRQSSFRDLSHWPHNPGRASVITVIIITENHGPCHIVEILL